MLEAAGVEPSKTTVPFMSSWKDLMMQRSLGGHPILGRILKRSSLLTRSKAFVKFMKATKLFEGEDHVYSESVWRGSRTVTQDGLALQALRASSALQVQRLSQRY